MEDTTNGLTAFQPSGLYLNGRPESIRRISVEQPAGELRVDAEALRRLRTEQPTGELHSVS